MLPKHSNPTKFRNDAYAYGFWARAPYNFVPLPEAVLTVDKDAIPGHHRYADGTYTGHIDCTLTTETPLYTRTALNLNFFRELSQKATELDDEDKKKMAPFFSLDGGKTPMIPGSSLRGMVRALVEIISFSKVHFVGDKPKFTFRAVAARSDDPLGGVYRQWINAGKNVYAGYLEQRGDRWFIHPALRPEKVGWPNDDERCFIPVPNYRGITDDVRGLRPFGARNFQPQIHHVSFELVSSGRGRPRVNVSSSKQRYGTKGVLVVSGDMLETGRKKGRRSPRKKYALIPDKDHKAKRKPIPGQVIEDYLDSLTEFQTDKPFGANGVLKDGNPVFYVERNGQVAWIGHTPNFRIPAWVEAEHRAVTPLDMAPEHLRRPKDVDVTEAIFGYTPREGDDPGRAGRVFFTDAKLNNSHEDVWYSPTPITPKILSTPKPTTFQHYLVQDKRHGHDPDRKERLAHWATSPDQTVIRGHKLYWHNNEKLTEADFVELDDDRIKNARSQYTRIKPVKEGVSFTFRIYFENLRDWELGALLWALELPATDGRAYRHKLGMAKPLGLGTVHIRVEDLHLSDRKQRYQQLFSQNEQGDLTWFEMPRKKDADFVQAFVNHVWERLSQEDRADAQNFYEIPRIRMLLEMLTWPGPDPELTRYMEIQYPDDRIQGFTHNEFKERAVLPDPLHIKEVDYFKGLAKDAEVAARVNRAHNRGRHAGLTVSIDNHSQLGHIAQQEFDRPVPEDKKISDIFRKQRKLKAWVLYLQQHPKRIGLTLKRPGKPWVWQPVASTTAGTPTDQTDAPEEEPSTWRPEPPTDLRPGVEVEGKILAIEHDRLSVDIGLDIDASLTYRKIPDVLDEKDARARFKVGQKIKARLLKPARRGRWQLTMR